MKHIVLASTAAALMLFGGAVAVMVMSGDPALADPALADQPRAAEDIGAPESQELASTTVSGTLIIDDEAQRTFRVSGADALLVAPQGVDLRKLQGKSVSVEIDAEGQVASIRTSGHMGS